MSREDLSQIATQIFLSEEKAEEKIEKYFSLYNGRGDWINPEELYKLYVDSGKIIPSIAIKSEMFRKILMDSRYKKGLEEKISNAEYQKIGDHYLIDYPDYSKKEKFFNVFKLKEYNFIHIIDENGNDLDIYTTKFKNGELFVNDTTILFSQLKKDDIKILGEEIKASIEQKVSDDELHEYCMYNPLMYEKRMSREELMEKMLRITFIGNVLVVDICPAGHLEKQIYYKIMPNGKIKEISIRGKKEIC